MKYRLLGKSCQRIRLRNPPGRGIRNAGIKNLPLVDEIVEAAHKFLHRRHLIPNMDPNVSVLEWSPLANAVLTGGSWFNAAYTASANSVMEMSRSSEQTSGERPTRIRRTMQSRDRGCSIKRRRSSGGSSSSPSGASADFVLRRITDLTDSIRRPRCDRSSHAPIPSDTAASAVLVTPPRSNAVRNAV
jgi:hypothetical protein